MSEDRESKRIFRQPINYENGVLLPFIRDIAYWRVQEVKLYETGVTTLALILPDELRMDALAFWKKDSTFEDLTMDGKKDFDDFWVYQLRLLENNNICFPKLTFDIGHD